MGVLPAGREIGYNLKSSRSTGIYLFVIRGRVRVNEGIELSERDGLGLSEVPRIYLRALTDAEILLMEVPPARNN